LPLRAASSVFCSMTTTRGIPSSLRAQARRHWRGRAPRQAPGASRRRYRTAQEESQPRRGVLEVDDPYVGRYSPEAWAFAVASTRSTSARAEQALRELDRAALHPPRHRGESRLSSVSPSVPARRPAPRRSFALRADGKSARPARLITARPPSSPAFA
jgi:hypothetical protein